MRKLKRILIVIAVVTLLVLSLYQSVTRLINDPITFLQNTGDTVALVILFTILGFLYGIPKNTNLDK